MAILNFPSNPQVNDQYTGDNGTTYTYDGVKWVGRAAGGAAGTNSLQNGSYTVQVDVEGDLVLPVGSIIKDAEGNPISGDGDTPALTLTGTIPYVNNIFANTPVNFNRPNNSINTVDAIDTGLTIKRGNNGAIYNSAAGAETNWNSSQSPLGTKWNADGWGDLTDVETRTYTTFYQAAGGNNNIGSVLVHKEFVMHDTINDKYYKIKFHFWQPNNGSGANQSLDERSGFSYTRTLLDLTGSVYFVRPANDSSIVDDIDSGLSIKRDQIGGIYNSQEDVEWDPDYTPTGTLWNDDGWDNFTDITTRLWKPLYSAVHGQLGNHLVDRELLMHDTINDKYYTVKFTEWGSDNGGSFAYIRREINPTGTKLGITFADGSKQLTATTLGDLKVVNGNVIANAVQPGHGAEIISDVRDNRTWGTYWWIEDATWVTSGNQGIIGFDTSNPNRSAFPNFLNDLGRFETVTVRINGGDPQVITSWGVNSLVTKEPPATSPTLVTELRFDTMFRSRMYMGGEENVGFFLDNKNETFRVRSQNINLDAGTSSDGGSVYISGFSDIELRNNRAEYGGVRIITDGSQSNKTWEFGTDGTLQMPGSLQMPNGYALTGAQNQYINAGAAPTVVYTSLDGVIGGIKAIIKVVATSAWINGDFMDTDTQMCEIIVSTKRRFVDNGGTWIKTAVASVYGVTHTSDTPLATFTVNFVANYQVEPGITRDVVQILAEPTAAVTGQNMWVMVAATEMTND